MTDGLPRDTEALQRRATALRAEADGLAATYARRTWWRFVLVFFPIPFVLVLLRLEVEVWHYYVFGAAYLSFSVVLYRTDTRAAERCSAAVRAAEKAERQLSDAAPGPGAG